MLVGVAQIGVVVNHHYETAVIIPHAFTFRHKAVRLPGDPAVIGVCKAGDLNDVFDIVKLVKYRVIPGNVFDLSVGKDFSQLMFHRLPFEGPPKII